MRPLETLRRLAVSVAGPSPAGRVPDPSAQVSRAEHHPVWSAVPRRLVILQYAGDYREAYERLAAAAGGGGGGGGGEETYHAQRYSVERVAALGDARAVATVCCQTETHYDVALTPRLRAIGAAMTEPLDGGALVRILERLAPTEIVLRTPIPALMAWAAQRRIRTLALLAESLAGGPRSARQVELLNHPVIEWVSCHLGPCAEHYVELGVDPGKVIAWGWPAERRPDELCPKAGSGPAPAELIYVGALIEGKGVADALHAVARLRTAGRQVRLRLYGSGPDAEALRSLARQLAIDEWVVFAGVISSSAVFERMRAADVVLIPSRSEYPEAMPLTLEHSFCARTPAVVSAHPAFAAALADRQDVMLFAPGDSEALAGCVAELLSDRELYAHISQHAVRAWQAFQTPVVWGDLLEAWLAGTPEAARWLRERTWGAVGGTAAR